MGRPPKGKVIWADRVLRIVSRKTCPKCSRLLLPAAFGPDKRSATGLASWCNECIGRSAAVHRDAMTLEERVDFNVKRAAEKRRWVAANPEAAKAAWRRNQARYREVHPDRIEARSKVDSVLRALVLDLLGNECLACGATEDLTVDHVGDPTDNNLTNLQVLCQPCNSSKGEAPTDHRNEFQRAILRRFEQRAAQQKPEVEPGST